MLPTYSSIADSAHNWQLVHSATSMIMFHFFIGLTLLPGRHHPRRRMIQWSPICLGYWMPAFAGMTIRVVALSPSLRRNELRGFERALDLGEFLVLGRDGTLFHRSEGFRHVLDAAIPQFDLHDRLTTGERMRGLGLGLVRGQQIKTAAAVDRLAGLAHRRVDRRRFVAVTDAARQPLCRQRRAD